VLSSAVAYVVDEGDEAAADDHAQHDAPPEFLRGGHWQRRHRFQPSLHLSSLIVSGHHQALSVSWWSRSVFAPSAVDAVVGWPSLRPTGKRTPVSLVFGVRILLLFPR
jgi:hypothetical protein